MKFARIGFFVASILVLSGCSNALRMSPTAADEAARALGVASRNIELNEQDVAAAAAAAGVTEDTIRSVAPNLNTQSKWREAMSYLSRANAATEGDVRDVITGVACDAWRGKIATQVDLVSSVTQQLQGLGQDAIRSAVNDAIELYNTLYDATVNGTNQDKAAISLFCFALGQFG